MAAGTSDRQIYLRVLAPLILAIATLVVVSVGGFRTLAAARAYVGGESLWSKAHSRTVAHLRHHLAQGAAATPCLPLHELLAAPLGDQHARFALDADKPDLAAARAGFLQGGLHPGDINGMIFVYRTFGGLRPMTETIAIWRVADELIERLLELGERICAPLSTESTNEFFESHQIALDTLDAELIDVETRFSESLGRASRSTERALTLAILLLAALLAGGSTWLVTRSLRSQQAQRRELVSANTRWALAADAADAGVFVWQPTSNAIELDARARRIHGLDPDTPASLKRDETLARMHPVDRPLFEQALREAVDRAEQLRTRYRIFAADGSLRHVEAVGMLRDAPGRPAEAQMFGVLRDVTGEVAAAQLHVERDAARRVAEVRAEFLSRLSHELRTPLNAVLGMAQVLAIDKVDPLSATQSRRVQLILVSGWHLLRLVDDVLDVTAIDSGRLSLHCVPTDPRAALRASLALIEPERARQAVRVDDHWPAEVPWVLADPQRLQQVFANLLSNACKYSPHEGVLRLDYREDASSVRMSITDEGPGISADQLAGLFQPFKRLEQTAAVPGVGLGLVIVKLLTEQMQGRIEVTSEVGRGACFTLVLRRA